MKLRFVKFLTSRENEIEKKEEGGSSTTIARSAITQPGRGQSLCYILLLPSSFYSLPPPIPTSPHPPPPTCLPPRNGRVRLSSYLLPSCSASPFLLHKIPEAVERGGRGIQLALQLFCLTIICSGAQLAATLAPSPNRMAAASLRFQWHPLCGGWSHRKTKYENELSCFITFIDE